MTDNRTEFQRRRTAGLRRRHQRRLQLLGETECTNCGATTAGCDCLLWLAGRRCCISCSHPYIQPKDAA